MRFAIISLTALLAAACSTGGTRTAQADLAEGQTMLALDSAGNAFASDESGLVVIESSRPVIFFIIEGQQNLPVFFEQSAGGELTNSVPNFEGSIQMRSMAPCDCDGDGAEDDMLAADNPLDQIDTDGDGSSDLQDDDDDNDGVVDTEDNDRDGNGEDDISEDLDSDDDGDPDLSDDDDDGDGIPDADDDDEAGDSDGDGVDDADDGDDDNDGVSDGDESDDGDDDESDDDSDDTGTPSGGGGGGGGVGL